MTSWPTPYSRSSQANDESDELRATAAIGLGPVLEQADLELLDDDEFDDPESVPISLDKFRNIQDSLHKLYLDEGNPKEVRRRILEGSVRAPQEWHPDAIRLRIPAETKSGC